ncbi:MAG: type III-B CRISPR module RAMP protein Cmr1, partial [Anaerolineales bacterium]
MTNTMEITLKTLTPLWTGGVDGEMDRVHETGIIGSLRWWYEALVRGLGGWACDPTADRQRCPDQEGQRCTACELFGCTGWQRRFRLTVEDHTERLWSPPPNALNVRPPGRRRGWYLPPGHVGELTIHIQGDQATCSLLASLFLFLEQWGAIGAKPQLGYGVFRLQNREELAARAQDWAWKLMGDDESDPTRPDLRRFGFFRFRFSPSTKGWWTRVPGMERLLGRSDTANALRQAVDREMIPVSPALKNMWRFERWQGLRDAEREVFGTAFGRYDPVRSKIAVSWAYPAGDAWEVRGWVWLPAQ